MIFKMLFMTLMSGTIQAASPLPPDHEVDYSLAWTGKSSSEKAITKSLHELIATGHLDGVHEKLSTQSFSKSALNKELRYAKKQYNAAQKNYGEAVAAGRTIIEEVLMAYKAEAEKTHSILKAIENAKMEKSSLFLRARKRLSSSKS